MWLINDKGEKEYGGGKRDWAGAAAEAEQCLAFKPDVEEEMVADETVSCYNCRFRRWTASSFACYGSHLCGRPV